MSDILWCYCFCWAVYVLNHLYNRMIENIPEVMWRDLTYELHSGTLFIFGSKVYAITNLEAKKQLQSRSEKDPRDYMGITITPDQLPPNADGYFVGYASHTSVILAYDPEAHKIKRIHHAYVDEYNVRTHEHEQLTPNSVLLQGLPQYALDAEGNLDPKRVKLVTSNIAEDKNRLDPSKLATITIDLPPKNKKIGLELDSDPTYGFPLLKKINPLLPLRTQIPVDFHHNCWIVAINSDENEHVEPITAKFLIDELRRCQKSKKVQIQMTFQRAIKPVTG